MGVVSCTPSGDATPGDDCDDTDDAVHPDASEACGDTQDYDCDGWPDLLTANSHVTDNIAAVSNEVYEETSTVFVQSRGVFLHALPVTPKGAWRGAVVADFDNDGRLDAVLTRLGAPAVLLHNITEPAGRSQSTPRPRLLPTACGYASSCAGPLHIGLSGGLGQNVPQ